MLKKYVQRKLSETKISIRKNITHTCMVYLVKIHNSCVRINCVKIKCYSQIHVCILFFNSQIILYSKHVQYKQSTKQLITQMQVATLTLIYTHHQLRKRRLTLFKSTDLLNNCSPTYLMPLFTPIHPFQRYSTPASNPSGQAVYETLAQIKVHCGSCQQSVLQSCRRDQGR